MATTNKKNRTILMRLLLRFLTPPLSTPAAAAIPAPKTAEAITSPVPAPAERAVPAESAIATKSEDGKVLTIQKKTPEQRADEEKRKQEELLGKATEQIETAEEAVNEVAALGVDIAHARNLLQLAKSFMRGKNYEKALQYAVKSEHVARDLERRKKAS